MAKQALGITHVFPNAVVYANGDTGVTIPADGVFIPSGDLEKLTHSSEVDGFSVDYVDAAGSTTSYTGNCEKFMLGLISTYVTKRLAVDADRAADVAKTTPLGTSDGPSAITIGTGFSALKTTGEANKLKQTVSLSFIYAEPTTDLVDEDD